MEPIDFVLQCAPFDRLTDSEQTLVRQTVDVIRYGRGTVILEHGGAPSGYLNIVRQGDVALMEQGRVVQVLEPGELFGYPSMVSQSAPLLDVVASTDAVVYRLPEAQFRILLDNVAFADYFLQSLGQRLRANAQRTHSPAGQNMAMPVKHLIRRAPLFVAEDATVQTAAGHMEQARASSVLVDSTPPGIITDRDLRGRVLAAGLGPQTPVHTIMTQPIKTLDSDTPVFSALITMLDENIHHLALVEEGQIVGVVTSTDLLRHQAQSPLYLQSQLNEVDDSSQLGSYADNIAGAIESLFNSGLGAAQVGRIISSLNDSLVKRLATLAEKELGPPPTPYAWIVFGSEGRSEQMLLTDQDNALIYQDESPAAAAYFAALAMRVVDGLIQAGFPPCPGGYMATNWCKPLAAWQEIFARWIRTPEPQALMEAGIFFDFRAVHGDLSLEPLEELLTNAKQNGLFIAHMVAAAQAFSPPLGFFNRIRSDAGQVDLKKGGIAPIVGLARACSLAAGSRERSTLERLVVAADAGTMSREGADNLAEVFQFLLRLRMRQQMHDLRAGRPPSNNIELNQLIGLEVRHLKEAFVIIRRMQDGIGAAFNTATMR